MALHFFLPLVAGGLMAIVWISTLGGGAYVLVSGLSIGAFVFALVATARNQAAREDT
jgi:glucose uptake protein GlcU